MRMLPKSPFFKLAALVLMTARPALSARDDQSGEMALMLMEDEEQMAKHESAEDSASSQCYDIHAEEIRSNTSPQCRKCTGTTGCKWCALREKCAPTSDDCLERASSTEQEEMTQADQCSTGIPEWVKVMNATVGLDWMQDEAEGGAYLDAKQCVQWSLGWTITPGTADAGVDTEDPAWLDAVGRWGCESTLLRVGVLALMGDEFRPWPSLAQINRRMTAASSNSSSMSNLEDPYHTKTVKGEEGAGWYADTIRWEPVLCGLIKFQIGKNDPCYVRAHAVKLTDSLRRSEATPNGREDDQLESIAESMKEGPLVPLSPGAGKSQSVFARTQNNVYKVKLGLRYEKWNINEPKNFVHLLKGKKKAPTLSQHLEDHRQSLLNRYYAMFKIRMGFIKSYVMVMGDAYYTMEEKAKEACRTDSEMKVYKYDLKGESRNQEEKKDIDSPTLINGNFKELENNTLKLKEEQCKLFKDALARDVEFLSAYGMIDYSLLVMSVHLPEPGALTCEGTPGEPFCMEHENHLYTFSLIDYLNDKTWLKTLEGLNPFRWGKFSKYAEKMMNYADLICPTTEQ